MGKSASIYAQERRHDYELISLKPVTCLRICMDYYKIKSWNLKDAFPMPFMDQMLDRLAGRGWYYLLDGYSKDNQICIAPEDQEKITALQRCVEFNFVLNWEKCPFIVKKGIVLEHKILAKGIEFDESKRKLVEAPIIVEPDLSKPFEIIWDAGGVTLGAELDIEVKDYKGYENQVANHLSRLEGKQAVEGELEIDDSFLDEKVLQSRSN
ncbi:uncharacterized protein LOC107865333 [Capsicum annuum]|uniref:uncharacterized protein LOC107865333 n=1 Tax=Capsicum annuum TaxID=4072 RepID=UPI0007BF0AEF|nr:uncharacterized protein LOC107865333 [Capsicum annuum]